MDAPQCRLCKAKHWSYENHVWKETRPPSVDEQSKAAVGAQGSLPPDPEATYPGLPTGPKPKKTPGSKQPAQPEKEQETRTSELKDRPESRDKYNERQREYMKKRRAQAKAKP